MRKRGTWCRARALLLLKLMECAFLGSLLRSAGALGDARMFQWKGTQASGTGCLEHGDCAAGHFCKAEEPPADECRSSRGWKVECGTCRPCAVCVCNEDGIDAQCPQDRCPMAPVSIPQRLGIRTGWKTPSNCTHDSMERSRSTIAKACELPSL